MAFPLKRARVLLADDHELVAAGLRAIVEETCEVLDVVGDGRTLVRKAEELKPDLILLDISMPDLNGIEAARQVRRVLPRCKMIFISVHTDATFVREALRAGGSGYVAKRCAPSELQAAIQQVLDGNTYLTPVVTKSFVDSSFVQHGGSNQFGTLTTRQREVLQLVAEGHSNKDIADKLCVSAKTVEFHKANIARALGLRGTADVVMYALKHGIVALESE